MAKQITCSTYLESLDAEFVKSGEKAIRLKAKKYLLNQFDFFGIIAPKRRLITKEFLKKEMQPEDTDMLVRLLWRKDQREFQYFGMELLEENIMDKGFKDLKLLEFMITHKSWWDTIDFISPKLVGAILKEDNERLKKTCEMWIKSECMWLRRAALLCQMKFKDKTNEVLLFDLVKVASKEKDFFIRKAIGWALREYSKTNPDSVQEFVDTTQLSNLSKKEALKRIPNQ
jgi:3-methyladenine DNA glycosylase AlkD